MNLPRQVLIRSLFNDYIKLYASRDERLTTRFSDNFSGYTGGGDFLVNNKDEWVAITRQDFAQVPGQIRIDIQDLLMQDLSADIVVTTGLFHIRLPMPEKDMSREWARLTLIFRLEDKRWNIVYSGISIPDQMVRGGEVYPIKGLIEQNQALQRMLEERTNELESAHQKLRALTPLKNQVRQCLESRLTENSDEASIARALNLSTRTLVRRLQAEDTTFLQVKDHLRQDIALRLLRETQEPVEDIAARIGFESLTAFHRSFKIWTGSTPLVYRRNGERRRSDRRRT
jgi:AraC-like DNA-binding protein